MIKVWNKVKNLDSVWFVGAVLLGLTGLEIVLSGLPGEWRFYLNLGLFVVGGVVGYYLVDLEQILFVFLTHPEAESSQLARKLWQKRRYRDALRTALYYRNAADRVRLPFTNLMFMLVWPVVSFYLVFSSGSSVAVGLALVVYWRVWFSLYGLARLGVKVFDQRAGWMIERELNQGEIRVGLWILLGLLLLLVGAGL